MRSAAPRRHGLHGLLIILSHVFDHQTHDRSQIHGILTGFGRESPVLDLMVYLRDYAANDQSSSL
ncbi:MAG: hypothetical protein WAN51_04360 [Alphaproteobacteria bacterium]